MQFINSRGQKVNVEPRAPLPFQGQKKNFQREFTKQIKEHFDEDCIFVDLFGGSGLLSHAIKRIYPDARVIWNDFDDYSTRLAHAHETNELLAQIREVIGDAPKEQSLSDEVAARVKALIMNYDGYVDVMTLGAGFKFSGFVDNTDDPAALFKGKLYDRAPRGGYNAAAAASYLDGVEVRRCDYRSLFDEFKDHKKVVFIADPPYLETNTKRYRVNGFGYADYLDINDRLRPFDKVFFTSDKTPILLLDAFLKERAGYGFFAEGFELYSVKSTASGVSSYTDYMIVDSSKSRKEALLK